METEEIRVRRKFLMARASLQVVNTILYGDGSMNEKMRRFTEAQKIAKKDKRSRVYIEDMEAVKP